MGLDDFILAHHITSQLQHLSNPWWPTNVVATTFAFLRRRDSNCLCATTKVAAISVHLPFKAPNCRRWFLLLCLSLFYDWIWMMGEYEAWVFGTGMGVPFVVSRVWMRVLYFLFWFLRRCEMKMMMMGEWVALSKNVWICVCVCWLWPMCREREKEWSVVLEMTRQMKKPCVGMVIKTVFDVFSEAYFLFLLCFTKSPLCFVSPSLLLCNKKNPPFLLCNSLFLFYSLFLYPFQSQDVG